MIKEIRMPNLGTTIDELKIVAWRKSVGDRIERGEILFEVETDKATMEVESYCQGSLKHIVVEADGIAHTGAVVAYIGDESDVFDEKTGDSAGAPDAVTGHSRGAPGGAAAPRISPLVRHSAEKLGVDWRAVRGTGLNGMITRQDVDAAPREGKLGGTEPVAFGRTVKATARAMILSKTTIPHAYYAVDIDMSALVAQRRELGKSVSYNALLIEAAGACLKEYPYLAARYTDEGRIMPSALNIGLAMVTGDELYAPVVKDATAKNAQEIEAALRSFRKKLAAGTLSHEDIAGGVFTISNLGSFGVDSFAAVINPPEAAILAVGAIRDRCVVADGEMRMRPVASFTLSADHRLANGAYAAGFLKALKDRLEGKGAI